MALGAAALAEEASVRLDDGTRLPAEIVGLEDGVLTFRDARFVDPLRVSWPGVDRVEFGANSGGIPERLLVLANGDHLPGRLLEIGAGELRFDAEGIGELTLPLVHVATIYPGGEGRRVIFEHDFAAAGELGDWKPRQGKWEVRDGAARCVDRGSDVLGLPVDGTGSCTLEVVLDGPISKGLELGLFVEKLERLNHGGLQVMVGPRATSATFARRQLGTERYGPPAPDRVLLHYDKAARSVGFSLPGRVVRMDPLLAGNEAMIEEGWVAIAPRHPLGIRSVRMVSGVVPAPGTIDDSRTRADEDHVTLSDGAFVHASEVKVADGKLEATTGLGRMEVELGKVERIGLRSDRRWEGEAPEGLRQVAVSGGLLSLEVDALDAETLHGRSPLLGELRLPRERVLSIRAEGEVRSGAVGRAARRAPLTPARRAGRCCRRRSSWARRRG